MNANGTATPAIGSFVWLSNGEQALVTDVVVMDGATIVSVLGADARIANVSTRTLSAIEVRS